ncbi:MAG: hypothetical protein LBU16_03910, partial [Treponema sp.]|nr:hypothetical protein [Treponema sp.]
MPWPTILGFLSFFALSLGISMIYRGRKAGKISWMMPLLIFDEAIWIAGVAVAAGSHSPLVVGAGLAVTEIAINLSLPLTLWYQIGSVNKVMSARNERFIRRIAWVQSFVALVITFLVFFPGYRRVEYLNGAIQLILVKNPAFYIALLFSIVSPLLSIFFILRAVLPLGYTRDIRQGMSWIVTFSITIVWLVIRFYFPGTYKYGCFMLAFGLISGYHYSEHYQPAITSATNLADYIYYLAKIPLLLLAQDGKILLANNSALS